MWPLLRRAVAEIYQHLAELDHDQPRLSPHVERALQARARDILCSEPTCMFRSFEHSHPDGWPEHPSYKGLIRES